MREMDDLLRLGAASVGLGVLPPLLGQPMSLSIPGLAVAWVCLVSMFDRMGLPPLVNGLVNGIPPAVCWWLLLVDA